MRPPSTGSLSRTATGAWMAAVITLVLGTVLIWVGFSQVLGARQRLFDRFEPAMVAAQQLRSSMVDQETGLRGYALQRDDRLLDPYRAGRTQQASIEHRITTLFAHDRYGPQVRRDVTAANRSMERWRRTVAAPILAPSGGQVPLDAVSLQSKAAFDQVRRRVDLLDAGLSGERVTARNQLDTTTRRLVVATGTVVLMLGIVSLGISWLLRRQVVAPIERLVAATDKVAAGDLREPIEATGPAEIRHLSARVSEMRDHMLEDIATAEQAREELDRRAVELARSNDDLEQFAYVASHDLQEPLRKVASFCQLLEQRYGDELDEQGRSYIAFAVDGAKRMQALIADLLEFSRLGRSGRPLVPCDLGALAAEVVDDFSPALSPDHVAIGPLPTVEGDPALLRALLHNLVGNTVKYAGPDTPPSVALTAECRGDDWEFAFADTGIGIEPRYRDQVFVIFQRLHGRSEFDGTGIGLALCKKVVEFSGGHIWIADPIGGVGTTVRWTLPKHSPESAILQPAILQPATLKPPTPHLEDLP